MRDFFRWGAGESAAVGEEAARAIMRRRKRGNPSSLQHNGGSQGDLAPLVVISAKKMSRRCCCSRPQQPARPPRRWAPSSTAPRAPTCRPARECSRPSACRRPPRRACAARRRYPSPRLSCAAFVRSVVEVKTEPGRQAGPAAHGTCAAGLRANAATAQAGAPDWIEPQAPVIPDEPLGVAVVVVDRQQLRFCAALQEKRAEMGRRISRQCAVSR